MRRWWQKRGLRFQLALWYAIGGGVLLATFSATLYLYVARWVARPLDQQLRRDLGVIVAHLSIRPDGAVLWDGRYLPEHGAWPASNPWFELWDSDGKLVRRLWPFTDDRIAQVPVAPVPGRETISVFDVAPDLRLRVLSVPYAVGESDRIWMLRVMRVHEPVGDTLGALRLIILVALPVVLAALVIGGYLGTRRSLLPLDQMAAEATRITANDLGRRLPVVNPHDELGQLAIVFNVTLDRLEASFRALDRFAVDASHELRTPLTTLRSVGEVGLKRSRTPEEYREIIESMLEEAHRLGTLVERLLELASAEGGGAAPHFAEAMIDEAVASSVAEFAILAEAKGQTLTVKTVPCRVVTDAVLVRQAVQNLIDNAIKHCPAGASIEVNVVETGEVVRIVVNDNGPGISPENRKNLAERFFRPDPARRSGGGFGLGLSITKAYAHVVGGTLEFEPIAPHGSSFHLVLPKRTEARRE